jgi:hypothetical protein
MIVVENKSNKDIYLITKPTRESFIATQRGSLYDSIISNKINNSDSFGIYKIKPKEKIDLFGNMGTQPTRNYFPFESVKIMREGDTIDVNKDDFIEKISRKKKIDMGIYYYIEIF